MPYIKQEQRDELNPHIEPLAQKIWFQAGGSLTDMAGILNYTITKIILRIIESTGGVRYKHIAIITGVLENVKQELYRRMAAPYENKKCAENGDVY